MSISIRPNCPREGPSLTTGLQRAWFPKQAATGSKRAAWALSSLTSTIKSFGKTERNESKLSHKSLPSVSFWRRKASSRLRASSSSKSFTIASFSSAKKRFRPRRTKTRSSMRRSSLWRGTGLATRSLLATWTRSSSQTRRHHSRCTLLEHHQQAVSASCMKCSLLSTPWEVVLRLISLEAAQSISQARSSRRMEAHKHCSKTKRLSEKLWILALAQSA